MEQYKSFLVPGAILAAGALVAAAIYATGGLSVPQEVAIEAGTENQPKEELSLGPELYLKLAQQLGVDAAQFQDCVAQRRYKDKVEDDYQEGVRLGIRGTPGSFVNGQRVSGAVPYDENSPGYRAGMQTLKSLIVAELAATHSVLPEELSITEKDHIRGNPNARITLVEYSDLQCPFCKRFHPTVQQALEEYGGQIRWVYKHYPIDQIHPQARPAGEAAECIGEQKGNEGFWQFVDAVFALQG